MSKFSIKQMVLTAMFIAIGVVLPLAFHAIPNAGRVFLPMHIPILLCGIIVGFPYGLACGIITPLLSSLFTGMPPTAMLPSMLCELAAYGMVSSLLMRYVKVKNTYAKIYISLIGAMLFGRVFYGILNSLIFNAGAYSMQVWLTAAFVTALPGVAIQIIIIPTIVIILRKARLIDGDEHRSLQTESPVDMLGEALRLIQGGAVSCVVIKDGVIVHTSDGRGVSPLLEILDQAPDKLKNAFVVDKIIGKAAAMVLVLGGVRRVYGIVMSAAGNEYLNKHGVIAVYGEYVDTIFNSDGVCPIEKSVIGIVEPIEGLRVIKETLDRLKK